ncbi:MAG: hypothetical protein KIT54_07010 [Phycisphaeraceae bacterium]|nr:hypothetical protein [Phycisphaeraceae bacterium]
MRITEQRIQPCRIAIELFECIGKQSDLMLVSRLAREEQGVQHDVLGVRAMAADQIHGFGGHPCVIDQHPSFDAIDANYDHKGKDD